jgi:hypothetical protein
MESMLPFLTEERTRLLRREAALTRRAQRRPRQGRWHLRRNRH